MSPLAVTSAPRSAAGLGGCWCPPPRGSPHAMPCPFCSLSSSWRVRRRRRCRRERGGCGSAAGTPTPPRPGAPGAPGWASMHPNNSGSEGADPTNGYLLSPCLNSLEKGFFFFPIKTLGLALPPQAPLGVCVGREVLGPHSCPRGSPWHKAQPWGPSARLGQAPSLLQPSSRTRRGRVSCPASLNSPKPQKPTQLCLLSGDCGGTTSPDTGEAPRGAGSHPDPTVPLAVGGSATTPAPFLPKL